MLENKERQKLLKNLKRRHIPKNIRLFPNMIFFLVTQQCPKKPVGWGQIQLLHSVAWSGVSTVEHLPQIFIPSFRVHPCIHAYSLARTE